MDELFATFHPLLQPILQEKGITTATEIQRIAIPQIQEGKDCLLIAPTGSGKTEAALLPLIDAIIKRREEKRLPSSGILVLYVTPLRALNRDIYRRIQEIGQMVDVTIQVRHGDTLPSERRKQALKPPQILITTPETLQAILPGKVLRKHLRTTKTVIIDELHSLVDNKRGAQLSLALERLQFLTRIDFQRIGLSATIGSPERVAAFLAPNSSNVKILIDPTIRNMEINVEYLPMSSNSTVNHLTDMDPIARIQRIIDLTEDARTVLIFTNTRQMAEILGWRLKQAKLEKELSSEVHHSSLGREVRLKAEQQLREGDLDVIVATSSLELGIDIGDIDHVIQYMSPRRVTTCVQRVGRAGHNIGHGKAIGTILCPDPRDLLEATVIAQKSLLNELEETEICILPLDVLLHQLTGFILDIRGNVPLFDVYQLFIKAFPFQQLTMDRFIELAEFASNAHLLWVSYDDESEEYYVSLKKGSFEYYFNNLSMIPDVKQFVVIDITSSSKIGILDEEFMTTKAGKGVKFILKGSAWKILSIEEKRVLVSPIKDPDALPTWSGELIPVSSSVAQGLGDLLFDIPNTLPVDDISRQTLTKYATNQQKTTGIPTKNRVIIESAGPVLMIHALLGSKASETLGILISGLMEMRIGATVGYRSDPYSVALFFPSPRTNDVIDSLKSLQPESIRPFLEEFVRRTDLFFWHLQIVAKRMGLIAKDYKAEIPMRAILSRYVDTIAGYEAINEIFFDKLDVKALELFFKRLNVLNEITLDLVSVSKLKSPLARASLSSSQLYLFYTTPSQVILNTVKRRLEQTIIRLTCMNIHCNWTSVRRIVSLEEIPVCPSCESRYIATSHENVTNLKKLLRKEQTDPDLLEPEERKELRTAKRAADLVLSFGKRAAYVLAGRGVGPVSAARILRDPDAKDEMGLVRTIIRVEAEFARTREYWG
ncbi:MAG: DEAD/DEAH box helicase [Promethearchaeota archaeon]